MNFLEFIVMIVLILILIIIVNNIILFGQDLARYPKKTTKDIKRDIDNYYPGSPNDDYDSDSDSESDKKRYKPKPHKKHYTLKPRSVAHYVSSHM